MGGMGGYFEQLAAIATAKENLENSYRQLPQVTFPTEQFVIQRVTGLSNITGVETVAENNDPNGNLGKAGGYTSCVYMDSDLVDPIDKYQSPGYTGIPAVGTDGSAAVEVYSTVEDAQRRGDYLAQFDGARIASGSHTVAGTCLVRTSSYLTAS